MSVPWLAKQQPPSVRACNLAIAALNILDTVYTNITRDPLQQKFRRLRITSASFDTICAAAYGETHEQRQLSVVKHLCTSVGFIFLSGSEQPMNSFFGAVFVYFPPSASMGSLTRDHVAILDALVNQKKTLAEIEDQLVQKALDENQREINALAEERQRAFVSHSTVDASKRTEIHQLLRGFSDAVSDYTAWSKGAAALKSVLSHPLNGGGPSSFVFYGAEQQDAAKHTAKVLSVLLPRVSCVLTTDSGDSELHRLSLGGIDSSASASLPPTLDEEEVLKEIALDQLNDLLAQRAENQNSVACAVKGNLKAKETQRDVLDGAQAVREKRTAILFAATSAGLAIPPGANEVEVVRELELSATNTINNIMGLMEAVWELNGAVGYRAEHRTEGKRLLEAFNTGRMTVSDLTAMHQMWREKYEKLRNDALLQSKAAAPPPRPTTDLSD